MDDIKENFISRLFSQSSHYFIGYIVVLLAGLISMPILTRLLSKSQYGILSLVSITLFILVAISKLGLQHSAIRFFDEFKSGKREDKLTVFYTTLFWSNFFFSLFLAVIFWITAQLIFPFFFPEIKNNLIWVISGLIVTGTMTIRIHNFLLVEQRTKFVNFFSIIHRYTILAFSIGLVYKVSKTADAFFIGTLLAEILIIIIFIYKFFNNEKIQFTGFSIPFLKECTRYGLPLLGTELIGFLLIFSDRYLIQFFLGSESVAIYSVGCNLCYYVKNLISIPVLYAILPLYMELYNDKGIQATQEFIIKVLKYILLLSIPMMVGLSVLAKQIITILASAKYEIAAEIIPYMITGIVFWSLHPLFAAGIFIYKKTKKLTLQMSLIAVINVILNIILIPRMGIMGGVFATFTSYIILSILVLASSSTLLKIWISIHDLMKYIFSSAIMLIMMKYVCSSIGISSIFIISSIGILTYTCILMLIDKNIRVKITDLLFKENKGKNKLIDSF